MVSKTVKKKPIKLEAGSNLLDDMYRQHLQRLNRGWRFKIIQ